MGVGQILEDSPLNDTAIPPEGASSGRAADSSRRQQLIEVTLASLAELGAHGTTLASIASRAGVSPGLVAHYFVDKDGLLEAAFRALLARHREQLRWRLTAAAEPLERLQACIEACLSVEALRVSDSRAWLAFWSLVHQSAPIARVQRIYQRRMLSSLRGALRPLLPQAVLAERAAGIAALLEGTWLQAALTPREHADSAALCARVLQQATALATGQPMGAEAVPDPAPRKAMTSGAAAPEYLTSHNPATGELLGSVQIAGGREIDEAVARARAAQPAWAALTGTERARILRRVADILRQRNDELALIEMRDTGKPIQETRVVDIVSGVECFEYFAAMATGAAGEHIDLGPAAFGYTRREPLGVVAGIGAWNYPMQSACWKTAPALAFGNAMIFKPAELTPLSAAELPGIMRAAGVPDGVFQVVHGATDTGRLLVRHPGIAKVSLTGAVETGKAVMGDAAATLKHLTLELGGKSPLLIFPDAQLDQAVSGALLGNFYSAGEVCSNATRVFVHRSIKDEFLRRLLARVAVMKIGDPADPATQVGSLISEEHLRKVMSYIERGQAEGARLLIGGKRLTDGALARGFFVTPTVFDRCRDDMSIVREEIFGPVMMVLDFDDEAEAIERANATHFGLSAGVFTNDLNRAHRVIERLQAGSCWINHYNICPMELPFGGYKHSGFGRENGRITMEYYTQLKSVYVAKGNIDSPY
ncbi:MAG: betaine-aldehyde dehydrogenase [Gammaproteobacteria bacterium]|nr:betaine-aldehyde dehydrogenase [Gammaproteobacteria bacterium]